MMLSKVRYQTEATATGGRDGDARTHDGSLNIWLGLPHELGGKDGGNNPEPLFAAHETCPYSNAVRGHVDVTLQVL